MSCLIESLNKGKVFEGKVQGNGGCFFELGENGDSSVYLCL